MIPIHTTILPYIKKRYNKDNKYLITIDGKPVSYYEYKRYIFEPILKQLGMKHTPHETRHTTATKLHEVEKYDKLGIKRILGHATQDITARYTRSSIESLRNIIDKLNWNEKEQEQ